MSKYQEFGKEFAYKAGEIIKRNFSLNMKKEWKSYDTTPVTETDLKINSMLIEEISKLYPDHSVKGEEESNIKKDSEYMWVCDPVDGTIPFSHGIPVCTFSLALVHDGESVLGVVYDPFGDRLFVAEKGEGAYLNGDPIHVSDRVLLKGSVGDYEFFETAKYNIGKFADHLTMIEEVKMMKLCSFIYPSTLVAAGELAFTLFPGSTSHDAAAVKIIVEEAGGKVTDIFGNEQRYDQPINGLIVSNGMVHDKLVELAKKFVVENV